MDLYFRNLMTITLRIGMNGFCYQGHGITNVAQGHRVFRYLHAHRSTINRLVVVNRFQIVSFRVLQRFCFQYASGLRISYATRYRFGDRDVINLCIDHVSEQYRFGLARYSERSNQFNEGQLRIGRCFQDHGFLLRFRMSSTVRRDVGQIIQGNLLNGRPVGYGKESFRFAHLLQRRRVLAPCDHVMIPSFVVFRYRDLLLQRFCLLHVRALRVKRLTVRLARVRRNVCLVDRRGNFLLICNNLTNYDHSGRVVK